MNYKNYKNYMNYKNEWILRRICEDKIFLQISKKKTKWEISEKINKLIKFNANHFTKYSWNQ